MEFKEFNEINREVLKPTEQILKAVRSSFILHQKHISKLDAVISDMKKFIKRFNNDFSAENYHDNFDLPVIFTYAMIFYSDYGKVPFTREHMKKLADNSDHYMGRKLAIIGLIFLSLESLGAIDGADDKKLNPFEESFFKRLNKSVTDEEKMIVIGLTIYALTIDYDNEGKYVGEDKPAIEIPSLIDLEVPSLINLEIPSLINLDTAKQGLSKNVSDDPLN